MKQMMAAGFAPKFDGSVDVNALRTTINEAQKRMPTEPGVTFEKTEYGSVGGEINHPQEEDDSTGREPYICMKCSGDKIDLQCRSHLWQMDLLPRIQMEGFRGRYLYGASTKTAAQWILS